MANLHKTERKLPWRVRDAGLPSDWLRGRIGGKFSAVKLVWHARHSSKERIHTPSWGKLKFVFYSTVCVLKKQPKNSHVFIALAREF